MKVAEKMYDVIVIGAGPAGCCAARTLAGLGKRVLLVERFNLPRYKSCSGVLISKAMELTERFFGESVPEAATCSPAENRGMIFTSDSGKEYRFEQPGLNVRRSDYDSFLAEKAAEAGAELRCGTAALDCAEYLDHVELTLRGDFVYTEKASYVLDCEGVVGAFKRKITGASGEYITTFQTFNDGVIDLDPHYFYAYLQPELSEYDAWFNVKDNKVVLGVSVSNRKKIPRYYAAFLDYMTTRHGLSIKNELKREKWLMPHIRKQPLFELSQGRIFFAGEIAGFLNPMGEGISAALESGFNAANALLRDDPNAAADYYKAALEPLITYMTRQWHFVEQIVNVELRKCD